MQTQEQEIANFQETAKNLIIGEKKSIDQVRYMLKKGEIQANLSEEEMNQVFRNISNLYKVTRGIEISYADVVLFNILDAAIAIGILLLFPYILPFIPIFFPAKLLLIPLYYVVTEAIFGRTLGQVMLDSIRVDKSSKQLPLWRRMLLHLQTIIRILFGITFFFDDYYTVSYRAWKEYGDAMHKIDELGK